MSIPSGVQKVLTICKETTWGTAPAAGSVTAQILRRTTAEINLTKATFESNEIRNDQQTVDYRHGSRKVEGTINGEVSCLTYKQLFEAAFRAAFVAGVTTGALTTVAAANTGTTGTYTRSAGSFITDGFKIGDLVLVSGYVTAGNNGQRIVTGVTATVLSVYDPSSTMATEAAGPSVTILVDGKKLKVPSTGHTNDSFTIEQFYEMGTTDVDELAVGCKISTFNIQIGADGIATVSFGVLGKTMTSGSAPYFSAPVAATSTGVHAGGSGVLLKSGVPIATVTGINFQYDGGAETAAVVGSSTTPDVFMGRFKVTGQFTAYFQDGSLWTAFDQESELSLIFRLQGGSANDENIVIHLPRIKLGGATKDDKETGGIIQTVPFVALKYVGAGQYDGTTMVLQDTEA